LLFSAGFIAAVCMLAVCCFFIFFGCDIRVGVRPAIYGYR
jgi:hypothetical protein